MSRRTPGRIRLALLAALGVSGLLSCSPSVQGTTSSTRGLSGDTSSARAAMASTPIKRFSSRSQYYQALNLEDRILARGRHGRVSPGRPMRPRFITIHATANPTGGADAHARALNNGALRAPKGKNRIGYLIWHFTVEDSLICQHLPTSEQGEHADFDGPGNNYSIGIEMCEHRGDSRGETIDRTARLAAWLMVEKGIPLGGVVPHYHWPREGLSQPNKPCPRWMMDNGRPGETWRQFMERVQTYERQLRSLP